MNGDAEDHAPVMDPTPVEESSVTESLQTPAPSEDAVSGEEPIVNKSAQAPASMKPREPRLPLPSSLQEIVGALLFSSQTPLTPVDLRESVRSVEPSEDDDAEIMNVYKTCTSREIEQALRGLEKELARAGVGFRLVCAAGAYRLQSAPSCGRYVRSLLKMDRPSRLSRAALETLAVIAYRQPVTKAEVEQIRGVAVDTLVKTLVDLQLVRLVGRSELPGHPYLYGTTPLFLEHFGLASLQQLNDIDPTLQRANPRERAKLFVKPVKQEQPLLTPSASEAAPAPDVAATPENEEASEDEEITAPETAPAAETDADKKMLGEEKFSRPVSSDTPGAEDDVFIDDTPDEFDDDEDDDEDDDDAEESEENEEGNNHDDEN